MIVNHLCTSLAGGASAAAQRLHRSLQSTGVDSRFLFSSREKTSSPTESMKPITWAKPVGSVGAVGAAIEWFRRKLTWNWSKFHHLRLRPEGYEIFTAARLPASTRYLGPALPGDIVHLHWVSKLIDYPSFFGSLSDDFPIVWTLHDMNPFTGGCHFSSGCERFTTGCGSCPQLANPGKHDISYRQFALKREAVRNKNLHVVGPSRWLLDAARRSVLLGSARSFHFIPYGLDTEHFFPRQKVAARQLFNVPQDAFVIGFGADSVTNRRKGWKELLAALSFLKLNRPTVALIFGGGELPGTDHCGLNLMPVGFVRESDRLANLYSAMDVFVMPSLEDNLPQTGLEAMACGTPVVAFNCGGIPDFVLHEQTGLLARAADPKDLAHQIQKLFDQPHHAVTMGHRARQLIVEQFNSRLEAARYTELYRELLAGRATTKRLQAA